MAILRLWSICTAASRDVLNYVFRPKTFHGNDVKNGFYASISELKKKDKSYDKKAKYFDYKDDYKNILDLCSNKRDLPNISVEDSNKILFKMKRSVTDLYDITPAHFINAGLAGLQHFNFITIRIGLMFFLFRHFYRNWFDRSTGYEFIKKIHS